LKKNKLNLNLLTYIYFWKYATDFIRAKIFGIVESSYESEQQSREFNLKHQWFFLLPVI
jgi:hypothetical protein